MLLKIAVIDSRETYRSRLARAFVEDYADRIEASTFSSMEAYDQNSSSMSIDVMLVASEFADEQLTGRRGAVLVYLVDDKSVESLYGKAAVCRYQKVDLLYKAILNACSERFDNMTTRVSGIEDTNIITFFPASGGVGASTMAAACAVAAARRGLRAFYLNLELFGEAETYFQAPGNQGLDDILFAIEAKKSGVPLRIQSATRKSSDGVYYITSCSNSTDIADLKPGHLESLVREIAFSDTYDVIVLDLDYAHSPLANDALAISHKTIFVSNGTQVANRKFERLYQMLVSQSRQGVIFGLGNVMLAYNNFRSRTGRRITGDVVPVAGGLNHVEAASAQQIVDTLAGNSLFDDLLFSELG